jgi:hypothetical protein
MLIVHFLRLTYCDMSAESLDINQRRRLLLGNGWVNTSSWQWICTRNNRRNIGSCVFCAIRPKAGYVHLTKAKHVHKRQTHTVVREDVT